MKVSKEQLGKLADSAERLNSPMVDPYFSRDMAMLRLLKEYKTHGKLVVGLDYDDTIFDYHKKGYLYTRMINLIKECQELGFYIVLFTGCVKDKWPGMIEYCNSIGIFPCKVNENAFPMPFGNDGKIYYNILFDDRSGLGEAYCTMQMLLNAIKSN